MTWPTALEDDRRAAAHLRATGRLHGRRSANGRTSSRHFGDLAPHLSDYLKQKRVVLLLDALNEMPQA